eukprot:gb/GECG01003478.1/.p1 GENE.gb/GECG01003478.1/~~gb/GECG01003478.1/.p1  ORF type:complete len:2610 (+),score=283.35 gb/GECG01003478.1/:1-7830(+)
MNKAYNASPGNPGTPQSAILNNGWTSIKIAAGGGKCNSNLGLGNNSFQTSGRSLQAWLCPSAGSCRRHGLASTSQAVCDEELSVSRKDKGSAESSAGADNDDNPEILDIFNDPGNFLSAQVTHSGHDHDAANKETKQRQKPEAWASPAVMEEEEGQRNSKRSDDIINTGYTSTTADSIGSTIWKNHDAEKLPVLSTVLRTETWEFWLCLHEVSSKPYLLTAYHREPAHISIVLRLGTVFQILPMYLVSRKVYWKRIDDNTLLLSISYAALAKVRASIAFVEREVAPFLRRLEQRGFQFVNDGDPDAVQNSQTVTVQFCRLIFTKSGTTVDLDLVQRTFRVAKEGNNARRFDTWEVLWQYLVTGSGKIVVSKNLNEGKREASKTFCSCFAFLLRLMKGRSREKYAVHPTTSETDAVGDGAVDPNLELSEIIGTDSMKEASQRSCFPESPVEYLKQLRLLAGENDEGTDLHWLPRNLRQVLKETVSGLRSGNSRDLRLRDQLSFHELSTLLREASTFSSRDGGLVASILKSQLHHGVEFPQDDLQLLTEHLLQKSCGCIHPTYEADCTALAWLATRDSRRHVLAALKTQPLVNGLVSFLDGILNRLKYVFGSVAEPTNQRKWTDSVICPYVELFGAVALLSCDRAKSDGYDGPRTAVVNVLIPRAWDAINAWFQTSRYYSVTRADFRIYSQVMKETPRLSSQYTRNNSRPTKSIRHVKAQSERNLMKKDRSISHESDYLTDRHLYIPGNVEVKENDHQRSSTCGNVSEANAQTNPNGVLTVTTTGLHSSAEVWEQNRTVPMLDLSSVYPTEPVTQSVRTRGAAHSNRSYPSSVEDTCSGSSAEADGAFAGLSMRDSSVRRKSLTDLSGSRMSQYNRVSAQETLLSENYSCKTLGRLFGKRYVTRFASALSYSQYLEREEGFRMGGARSEVPAMTKPWYTPACTPDAPLFASQQNTRGRSEELDSSSKSDYSPCAAVEGWIWSMGCNDDDRDSNSSWTHVKQWTALLESFSRPFDEFRKSVAVHAERELSVSILSMYASVIWSCVDMYKATPSLKCACVFKRASTGGTIPSVRFNSVNGSKSAAGITLSFPAEFCWSVYFETTRTTLDRLADGDSVESALGRWQNSINSVNMLLARLRDVYSAASETSCINHFNRYFHESVSALCSRCNFMSGNCVANEALDVVKIWICGCYSSLVAGAHAACLISDDQRRMSSINALQESYLNLVTTCTTWIAGFQDSLGYMLSPLIYIGSLIVTLAQQTSFTDSLNEEAIDESVVKEAAGTIVETCFALDNVFCSFRNRHRKQDGALVSRMFYTLLGASLSTRSCLSNVQRLPWHATGDQRGDRSSAALEHHIIQSHHSHFSKIYVGIQRALLRNNLSAAERDWLQECAWHVSIMGVAIVCSSAVERFVTASGSEDLESEYLDNDTVGLFNHSSWHRVERSTALLLKYLGIVSFLSLELGLEARFHERWLTRQLTAPDRSSRSVDSRGRSVTEDKGEAAESAGDFVAVQNSTQGPSSTRSLALSEQRATDTGSPVLTERGQQSHGENQPLTAQSSHAEQGGIQESQSPSAAGSHGSSNNARSVISVQQSSNLSPLSEVSVDERGGTFSDELPAEQKQVHVIDFTKSLSESNLSWNSSEEEDNSDEFEIGGHLEDLHEVQAKSNVTRRCDETVVESSHAHDTEEAYAKPRVPSLVVNESASLDISASNNQDHSVFDHSLSLSHSREVGDDEALERKGQLDQNGTVCEEQEEECDSQETQEAADTRSQHDLETGPCVDGGKDGFALAEDPLGSKDDNYDDGNFHVPPLRRHADQSDVNLGAPLDTAMTGTSTLNYGRQQSLKTLSSVNSGLPSPKTTYQPPPTVLTSTKVWFSFPEAGSHGEECVNEQGKQQNEIVRKHASRLRKKYLYARSLCPIFRCPDLHASSILLLLQCILDGTGVACRADFARRFPNQEVHEHDQESPMTCTSDVWCTLSSMFGTPTNYERGQMPSGFAIQRVQHVRPPTNVLYVLHHHLNHPANHFLIGKLHNAARQRGNHLVRLLRLLSGSLFNPEKYEVKEYISSGAYGRVCKAEFQEGSPEFPLAVKQLKLPVGPNDKCLLADLVTEVAISENLTIQYSREDSLVPPPVVRLFDYGVTDESYWLVMEECKTTLSSWRKKLGKLRLAHQRSLNRKEGPAPLERMASDQVRYQRFRSESLIPGGESSQSNTEDALRITIPPPRMRSSSALPPVDSPTKRRLSRNRAKPRFMTEIDKQEKLNNGLCLVDLPLLLSIFREIVIGVDFLHRKGVTHFDIKADNILMRNDPVNLPQLEEAEDSDEEEEDEANALFYSSRLSPMATKRQSSATMGNQRSFSFYDDAASQPSDDTFNSPVMDPLVHSSDIMSSLRGVLCLSDFGESTYIPGVHALDSVTTRPRGTDCIRSPEMLKIGGDQGIPQNNYFGDHSHGEIRGSHDVWSLGCLLFEILTGNQLFAHECEHEWVNFFVRVTDDKLDVLDDSKLKALKPVISVHDGEDSSSENNDPFGLLDLFNLLLMRNPRRRPSLGFVRGKVEDAILKSRNFLEQRANTDDAFDGDKVSQNDDNVSHTPRMIARSASNQPYNPSPLNRSHRISGSN